MAYSRQSVILTGKNEGTVPVYFESLTQAAEALNMSRATLQHHIYARAIKDEGYTVVYDGREYYPEYDC